MAKFRSVFQRYPEAQKWKRERGKKMKGRIPIYQSYYISMGDRPGPSSSNTKKCEFYKIMLGDFQKRLRIPNALTKLFSKELSRRAVLEGPSGNCWLVKLSSSKTGTYFKDGWETFQRDHSLTFAEFLVFKYTGDMHFKVMIFGINGCERCDTFFVEPSQGKLMSSPRPEVILGTNERCDAFVVEPSQGLTFGPGKKCQSFQGDKGKLMSSPRPERLILAEEETPYVSPQFPTVMCKMTPSYLKNPFSLTLPAKFARAHLPRTTKMVRLQDIKGRMWTIKLKVQQTHSMLSVGWKKFVEDNCLKVGDACRFQVVQEDVMKVKIYRC